MKLATGAAVRCSCSPATTNRPIQSLPVNPRPAAKIKIGKRWTDCQGANNWDGLLNPLDPVLRSEILRYGEFVKAAYTAFDSDAATCHPSTGYHVTRGLHASSSINLPSWAHDVVPSWLSRRSSRIGYVAVCQDEDEIDRLGRRDVVIAYRGTVTCLEWLENLRTNLTRLLPKPATASGANPDPMVQRGFWSLFTSPGATCQSLRDEVREEVKRIIATYGGSSSGKPISLTITGHSLGAALAVLTAYDITTSFENAPMVTVVSFGGPRVGNSSFRRRLDEQGSKVLRIVNTDDIITKVPGFVAGREVDDVEKEGMIPGWLLAKTGWVYADIGQELRVSGKRTANVAACHDLGVYLKLVNQMSESCPFRSKSEQRVRWPFPAQATASGH